jgi:hypothetical protein
VLSTLYLQRPLLLFCLWQASGFRTLSPKYAYFTRLGTPVTLRVLSSKSTLPPREHRPSKLTFIGHPFSVVYISYYRQVEDYGTTKWQPRFSAVRHYTLSMVLHSLATILYVELTACLMQRNNRYSSQEAQAASLLGIGSQFDNPKTSSTLEKDKNSAAVSMSQASQVGALQQTA